MNFIKITILYLFGIILLSSFTNAAPSITLVTPSNGNDSITSPVFFVSNVTDNQEVVNATLYTNESGSWAPVETRWNGEVPWNGTGLALLYHFNNESMFGESNTYVKDFSPYNHSATINGGVKAVSDGKIHNSFYFDGVDDSIITTLNIDQSSSSPGVTMSAWVYPTSTSSGRHQVISSDNGGYDWSILRESGVWYVFTGENSRSTGFSVNVNQWQHLVAVYKPGSGVNFYKNNIKVTIPYISYDGSDNNIGIGDNPGGAFEVFNGKIDEVAIWNRVLSDAEISNIYNYQKTVFYPVFQNRTLANGTYTWNVLAVDNQSNSVWAPSNYIFAIGEKLYCIYSGGGDWIINASNNCSITQNTIVNGSLYIYGANGITTISANVTVSGFYKENNNILYIVNGLGRIIKI